MEKGLWGRGWGRGAEDRRLRPQWLGARHHESGGTGMMARVPVSPGRGSGQSAEPPPQWGWESSQWCPGLNAPVRRLSEGRGRPRPSPHRGCIQPGPRGPPPSAGWREGTRPGAGHCVSEGRFSLHSEGQPGQEQPCGAGGPADKVGKQSRALGCQGAARGEARSQALAGDGAGPPLAVVSRGPWTEAARPAGRSAVGRRRAPCLPIAVRGGEGHYPQVCGL